MKTMQGSVALILLISASAAMAGGSNAAPFYLGAGVGVSSSSVETSQLADSDPCNSGKYKGSCSKDDKDKAWQVYGGMQVNDNFAVEGGYVNLGTTGSVDYTATTTTTVSQETDGFNLVGVGSMPIGGAKSPLSAYGKAGVYRWESKATVDGACKQGSTKKSGIDPTVGAGVQYEMSGNATIRAGWDRYYNVGEAGNFFSEEKGACDMTLKTINNDVDVLSAAVNYHFL